MTLSYAQQNQISPINLAQHQGALKWRSRLQVAHGVGWLADYEIVATMQAALHQLFGANSPQPPSPSPMLFGEKGSRDYEDSSANVVHEGFPDNYTEADLRYERDELGKPYVTWRGAVGEWAEARGLEARHLHVSNTHDGGAHIVLAAYHADLVGVGIDAVYLPRLAQPGKDGAYLHRFAARFMSKTERAAFEQASAGEDLEALRLRVAAHFSLMEAGSKALGTGLKIGVGMGRETSLPKQSIGVQTLEPNVQMLFDAEAQARMNHLGARRAEAHWSADATFLISVVFLWRR